MDTVSEFHAKAPQATASEGLAQGPYVAARAEFEPTTLRTKGTESTNEPPCPTKLNTVSNHANIMYKQETRVKYKYSLCLWYAGISLYTNRLCNCSRSL